MKLVKFLKHIDFLTDIEIYDDKDRLLYTGSVIPFLAIADKDKEYIKDLREEKDYEDICLYEKALKIKDFKLYRENEESSVSIKSKVNEYGVEIYTLVIVVRKG